MTTPEGPPPASPPSASGPSGPPSGPPPGPGSPAPAGGPTGPGEAGPGGISRNQIIAIGVAVALAVGVLVGIAASGGGGGDSDSASNVEKPIELEPISSTNNPFMPPVGEDSSGVTPPEQVAGGSGSQPQTYEGSLPGLYGGTRDVATCDPDAMITYLEANPDKATAWANVQGISTAEIATYVSELTPVVLRTDTAVTNHGFVNGRANEIPAVLQAGTAVLVDKYGVPRTKCYCGNPLSPPRYYPTPTYTGPRWPAFDPGAVVVVEQSTTVIQVITVIDLRTNEPFGRPVGANTTDVDAPDTATPPEEPPDSAAPSGEVPAAKAEKATGAVKSAIEECVAQTSDVNEPDALLTPEELAAAVAALQYAAVSIQGDVVTVSVRSPEGDFATWTVNIESGDITASDPTAAEVGSLCPALS